MGYGETIAAVLREVAELKRVQASLFKMGTVHEVDADAGTVRLKFGEENGRPILGPKIPWLEHGGAFKSWTPPAVGQTMLSLNPVGDQRQGMAIAAAFSSANPAPSNKGNENAWRFGDWSFILKHGELLVEGPEISVKTKLRVTGDVEFKNGFVKSNDKRIDDTHKHESAPPGAPGPPL